MDGRGFPPPDPVPVLRVIPLLLRPKLLGALGRGTNGRTLGGKIPVLLLAAAGAFAFVFVVSARLLREVREVPEVGPLLASKMLGLVLLLFLGILLLSNLIAALSSFFLAKDLPALVEAPVDWLGVYGARLLETMGSSSWMVLLMLPPVVAAYQSVYGGDLLFFAVAALALLPYLAIPAALGSAITLLLVRAFPARRTRDILAFVSIVAGALLVLGLRVLRPERLVNPEGFRNLVDFLEVLRAPSSPWLPSEWAAQAMVGYLEGPFDPFWLLLLWSTAGALVVGGAWLHRQLYAKGFNRAQEGAESAKRRGRPWVVLGRVLRPLGLERRELILKDARIFFRDATQWSQLLVLGVLLFVYIYNIRVLPIESSESLSRFLVSMVVFLNLALAGFILAAIAARFVFPAYSLEGSTLWLLRSSPLRPEAFVWSKYWSGAVPLLVLALALTWMTNRILGVAGGVMALSLVTITGLTLALVAQALAWGIALPKLESGNAAQIPTSLGGMLFMLGALVSLAIVLVAQFWALRGYVWSGLPGRSTRDPTGTEIALALTATLALSAVAGLIPYAIARKKLRDAAA
ncbi:MAG: putative ABC transporter permease subunit [Gemmatimonadota bacterium]